MTAYHSTPTVWFAARSAAASAALMERSAPFCDARELLHLGSDSSRVLHDVGTHAVALLVVEVDAGRHAELCDLAWRCSEVNPWFRCLVVGDGGECDWPKSTIYLPSATLSSVIIDRIRLEAHALRIAASRNRHVDRLLARGGK
jgi:hypothetical protein